MHSRMLGRSGHTDYFCTYGRKCRCERRKVKSTDTAKSRRQIRHRERRQLQREFAEDTQ